MVTAVNKDLPHQAACAWTTNAGTPSRWQLPAAHTSIPRLEKSPGYRFLERIGRAGSIRRPIRPIVRHYGRGKPEEWTPTGSIGFRAF